MERNFILEFEELLNDEEITKLREEKFMEKEKHRRKIINKRKYKRYMPMDEDFAF